MASTNRRRRAGGGGRINPRLAGFLAWTSEGTLFLIDARGAVHRGDRSLRQWEPTGTVGTQPVAFSATEEGLLAATPQGDVMSSDDGGRTWKVRATA